MSVARKSRDAVVLLVCACGFGVAIVRVTFVIFGYWVIGFVFGGNDEHGGLS
jgi:hypothetical protein